MTGSLIYTSLDEFEADYIDALRADLQELAADHLWWRESPSITENPRNPYLLHGANRIMRRYQELPAGGLRKIDYRDDVLMGMVDYLAILEMLTCLSKEHEFAWSVGYPSDSRSKEIGRIDNGEISPRLFDFLLPEMEALQISDKDLSNQSLHATIRAKYS